MENRPLLPPKVLGLLKRVDREEVKRRGEDRTRQEREKRANSLYEKGKTMLEEYGQHEPSGYQTPPVKALDREGREIKLVIYTYDDPQRYPGHFSMPPIIGINAERFTPTESTFPFSFRIFPESLPSRAEVKGPIANQNETGQSISVASSLIEFIERSLSEKYTPRSQMSQAPTTQRRGIMKSLQSLINRRRPAG